MDEARRLRRRAARPGASGSSRPASPAPQCRRRCGSSITRRSAGAAIRDSRQARWQVSALAARIVAASMARRCENLSKKLLRYLSQRPITSPAKDGGGLFLARSRKELCEAQGGTGARRSPPPSLLRPSRHATESHRNSGRMQSDFPRCSRLDAQPPARDACKSNPPSPLTQVSLSRTIACGGSCGVATARPAMRRTAVPTATNSIRPEPSSTM